MYAQTSSGLKVFASGVPADSRSLAAPPVVSSPPSSALAHPNVSRLLYLYAYLCLSEECRGSFACSPSSDKAGGCFSHRSGYFDCRLAIYQEFAKDASDWRLQQCLKRLLLGPHLAPPYHRFAALTTWQGLNKVSKQAEGAE